MKFKKGDRVKIIAGPCIGEMATAGGWPWDVENLKLIRQTYRSIDDDWETL